MRLWVLTCLDAALAATIAAKTAPTMAHELVREKAKGFGSWLWCKKCGAAYHNKLWHLANRRQAEEPPCKDGPGKDRWLDDAETIPDDA